jgi:hypothetical protein
MRVLRLCLTICEARLTGSEFHLARLHDDVLGNG